MMYYIKKYPVSIFILLVVVYLSFFTPPKTEMDSVPGIDKLVHVVMYFGVSGMLWLEFIRAHRKGAIPWRHVWIGACLCPILFSGGIELLQEYCTAHRSGDWLDFLANTTGILLASLVGRCVLRRKWL